MAGRRRARPSGHRRVASSLSTPRSQTLSARHRARTTGSLLTDLARDPRHRRSAVLVAPLVIGMALVVTVAATAAPGPDGGPIAYTSTVSSPFATWVIPTTAAAVAPSAPARVVKAVTNKRPAPKALDAAAALPVVVIPSALAASGIPKVALKAYKRAARTMNIERPSCAIKWQLLAAIGRVESNHGRSDHSVMTKSGLSVPGVFGPMLDGKGPFALILDTDKGKSDGNKKYDRAVGPMQFIPSTWANVARDGNHDGKLQVQNIWDASLGAADYLCRGKVGMGTAKGLAKNIYRYNHSDAYVALVIGVMKEYGAHVKVVPNQVAPKPKPKPRTTVRKPVAPAPKPAPKPVVKPKPSTPPVAPPTSPPATDPSPVVTDPPVPVIP